MVGSGSDGAWAGGHPVAEPRSRDSPTRLRRTGEPFLWLLVIAAGTVAALWLAATLRLVVLPVLLALVLTTLLAAPVGWLKRHGWPDALAAITGLLAAISVLLVLAAVVAPGAVEDFDELDAGVSGGIEEVQRWLGEGPLNLSEREITRAIDGAQEQIRGNVDGLGRSLVGGAVVVLEVLTGLALAFVLLFFFLKDGERIWSWLVGLAPEQRRSDVRRGGQSAWEALAGFLRGQTIVALFDALFIALALVLIGVPLVVPLALVAFFGAYVPVLGASVAGAAAALVALFAVGPFAALLVIAAILVVQQIEGNVLQPYVVGRTVDVHPIAILLGITAGGVLAGIIGIMVAAPAVAVAGALLRTLREPPPEGSSRADQSSETSTATTPASDVARTPTTSTAGSTDRGSE